MKKSETQVQTQIKQIKTDQHKSNNIKVSVLFARTLLVPVGKGNVGPDADCWFFNSTVDNPDNLRADATDASVVLLVLCW